MLEIWQKMNKIELTLEICHKKNNLIIKYLTIALNDGQVLKEKMENLFF